MAITKRRGRFWSRLHFLVRFAGLTGLLIGCVGLAVALIFDLFILESTVSTWETLQKVTRGESVEQYPHWSILLLLGGMVAGLFALVIEILVVLFVAAGRRSAFGFNAALQVALAAALLVGVNVYSAGNVKFDWRDHHFQTNAHYVRFDWTRDHKYTLNAEVQDQLRQLRGQTTIVVYQQHKTFGKLSDKPDAYDYAAERKVVEKVKDLVEQFQEFGPQFRVVVLDVEEDGYTDKLNQLTENTPELKAAIDAAPENSIFFHANGKVQRLSFNEFYQLDKTASKDQSNLVLLFQGVKPFSDKVLNLDEKRPKVGLLVIHEWLTTEGPEDFGLAGLKKSLTARGFDVKDIILKKWTEIGPPEPAVYTYEESKFERLEEQVADLAADLKTLEEEIREVESLQKFWKTATLDELTKKYAARLNGARVTERLRERQLEQFEQMEAIRQVALTQAREEHAAAVKEKSGLSVDSAAEQRRLTDLKAKLDRALADCDLIIVPRMTLRNVTIGDRIPNRVYRLDQAQVDAVKDFLKKAGNRSALFCFGPANEPADRPDPSMPSGPDGMEDLVNRLGIRLGNQTVLFNSESKSFAERRSGVLVSGANVEVPPVDFESAYQPNRMLLKEDSSEEPLAVNPIRNSMRIVSHSLGKKLDLKLRHPRPVYCAAEKRKKLTFDPEFILTDAASWNDDQPFPTRERTPRFEPKADDAAKGTPDEKRRGPFPIGVALETTLPEDWYETPNAKPPVVRVAAIGHGGVFVGSELSPAKEQLLLNSANWLLGRDELLPKDDHPWQYPRVPMNDRERYLWLLGSMLGLPFLFFYLGLVVLLVRRLR
jgi:hypothetical protein